MLFGIDVSHWQGKLDWPALKAEGVVFAFAKSTQSVGWGDRLFAENWAAMKSVGVIRGAYHYFLPSVDLIKQAAHFVSTVKPEPCDLPLALDVEIDDSLSPNELADSTLKCLQEIERLSGKRPIIYTSSGFWDNYVVESVAPELFSDYPLWVAHYTNDHNPRLPLGWNKWTFWQYTGAGRLAAHSGRNLDFNRFTGTLDDLKAFANPTQIVSSPTDVPDLGADLLKENARLKAKLRAIAELAQEGE
jgi:lysozyme